MKSWARPLLLTVILLLLYGCNPMQGQDTSITIGLCIDTLVVERWQRDCDIFMEEAVNLGAEVQIYNANGDIEVQKQQIRALIEQGVSAIVVIPIDSGSLAELRESAGKNDVLFIAYDRIAANANVDAFISFDTENIGIHMLNELSKAAPDGNYVLLGGSTIDANMPIIASGIKQELAKHPNIELVTEVYCENWSTSTAFALLSAILEENQDIQGVLCGNDSLAIGAIRALSECKLAGKVAVSGQDADLESCQRIVEGTQTMTVYKPLDSLARKAAQVTVSLCRGEEAPGAEAFFDGTYTIPRYMVPTVAVTKDNMMETVIADGFHSLEDVYHNVPPEDRPQQ